MLWYCDVDNNISAGEQNSFISDDTSDNISDINFLNKNEYLELLIAEVFQREALWNSLLPYKCRDPLEVKALWSEIDIYLSTCPGTSQSKWKNLRDRFVKKHALQSSYVPSGSAAVKKKSSWPFYENLLFLASTITYRKTKSNIENVNPQTNVQQKKEFHCSINNNKKKDDILQQSLPKQNTSNSNTLDEEAEFHSPTAAKRIKKSKTEYADIRIEEAILKELQQTRNEPVPRNEPTHIKPDKIESFTKYLEACLRNMMPDDSKRIIMKISKILFEDV
ncbi:uncharacterized protein LOC105181426 [Harpegnathos saltator]|uniref:uncharacterized protein LOC105181426 n=1 Tax=Harpegnathos saltator TaxID=610380 RepID=UPI00058DC97F|nr:uncharacterized protein LOC105181426 [Harpegnathos saltator]